MARTRDQLHRSSAHLLEDNQSRSAPGNRPRHVEVGRVGQVLEDLAHLGKITRVLRDLLGVVILHPLTGGQTDLVEEQGDLTPQTGEQLLVEHLVLTQNQLAGLSDLQVPSKWDLQRISRRV